MWQNYWSVRKLNTVNLLLELLTSSLAPTSILTFTYHVYRLSCSPLGFQRTWRKYGLICVTNFTRNKLVVTYCLNAFWRLSELAIMSICISYFGMHIRFIHHLSVIFLPLPPASLTHRNPQRRKIIYGMRPVGRKNRLIDLKMFL